MTYQIGRSNIIM